MCQFTSRDPIKKHRPYTRCKYTGQVAGPDRGSGAALLLLLLLAAAAAEGGGQYIL